MNRILRVVLFILLIAIVLLLPFLPRHHFDTSCWIKWCTYIHQHGLVNVYDCGADYLPLYQYVLWIYTKIAGSEVAIVQYIHYLKLFTLSIDLLGIWYVYKWIDKKVSFQLLAIICLLNAYNTLIWGQVDGMLASFVFISFYYADKDRMTMSALFFALALNFKLHAVVFLPIWGLMYISSVISKPTLQRIMLPAVVMAGTTVAAWFPFILKPGGVQQIIDVVTTSVDRFPMVGQGAGNAWNLLIDGNLMYTPDSRKWIGDITYKQGGLIMFFTASFILLFPLLKRMIKKPAGKDKQSPLVNREQIWMYCALVIMLFFFLNTQMHERYVHPALIFVTAYSFYRKDFFPLVLLSVTYLLNLERVMKVLAVNHRTFIFDADLFAVLYAVVIVYLYVRLVRSYRSRDASQPPPNLKASL